MLDFIIAFVVLAFVVLVVRRYAADEWFQSRVDRRKSGTNDAEMDIGIDGGEGTPILHHRDNSATHHHSHHHDTAGADGGHDAGGHDFGGDFGGHF
jgi:hypothetical protein